MLSLQLLRLILLIAFACLAACANIPLPREQTTLPAAPHYAPTATPSPTPLPPNASPTPVRPTLIVDTGSAKVVRPTIHPLPLNPTLVPRNTPVHDLAALNEYQRGIAYIAMNRDEYRSEKSRQALDELFATGANYISLLVTWYQLDRLSTRIYRAENTPSDEDLAYVTDYAHAHGIKVLLKPQVNFSADDAHWRGEIKFETEPEWQAWFDSYRTFIMHYARFAQTHGVEEFSVGTELVGATTRTADWRALIRGVRQEYTGLLTYSANHSGEEVQIRFWDDLDFIGVNVFYHLTNYRTPNERQIRDGWALPVRQLTNLHLLFPNQPIIFTEVGYPSMDLASVWPWNWQREGAIDTEEQAVLYEGLFDMWWYHPDRKWFRGMFIWNWLPDPDQGGPGNPDYTPHGKPAEEVLKRYYQMPTPMHTASGNQ